MSALNKGKHIVSEIDGVRCTIIETGITESRMLFLKDLLSFNHFEVKTAEEKKEAEDTPAKYTLGVTDILFNPVIAVYERSLKTHDGCRVSAPYWNQYTTVCNPKYWRVIKR
jgi:hypothetical protein